MKGTLADRLYSRLEEDEATGCLLWTGAIAKSTGYGRIFVGRRPDGTRLVDYVHRVAWQLEHGVIPADLVLDHVRKRGCLHRHCASIAHLEPVTQRENIIRGDSPIAAFAGRTHCSSNHRYDEANTYIWQGRRCCRACHRDRQTAYLARLATTQ